MAEDLVVQALGRADLFKGLQPNELVEIARICSARSYRKGGVVFEEDSEGDELYIVHKGSVEVLIWVRSEDGVAHQAAINTIWEGRSFGEMVLIGGGTRMATIRCVEDTLLLVIKRYDFDRLCARNPRIGYQVMRNIAEDLVYKLRSSSLLMRGQVKWRQGELGGWR